MANHAKIGIDLGGHTAAFALIAGAEGEAAPAIVRRLQRKTPDGRAFRDITEMLAEAIAELAEGADVTGVGIALPGMLDADRRHCRAMANFPPEWKDLDFSAAVLGALLARGLDLPVRIENDANCYALGEGSAGEARGMRDYVVLTMGTGIGSGIVANGRLLTGSRGMAGEAGHIVIEGDAPCGCGGKGHAETLAAADGTVGRAKAAGLPADFKELWSMRGDASADTVIETTLDAMARTIASVMHMLDPEVVVLGGGMSRASGIGDAVYERTLPYLARPYQNSLDLRISRLGDEAALYGAAALYVHCYD